MGKLKLIYFKDCPNAERAKGLLSALGLSYEDIVQDHLDHNDFFRTYTSPTLLRDTEIIFGESTGAACGGCSLGIPTLAELKVSLGLSS